jgi:hypothetical protein
MKSEESTITQVPMSGGIMDKKSDVKFVFINFEEYWDESNSYPMGILYISACLKRCGFTNIGCVNHVCMQRKMGEKTGPLFELTPPETRLEWMSEERKHNLERLFEYLNELQPHVILLGPVTTFNLVELMDLVRRLREQFPKQLILAGSLISEKTSVWIESYWKAAQGWMES